MCKQFHQESCTKRLSSNYWYLVFISKCISRITGSEPYSTLWRIIWRFRRKSQTRYTYIYIYTYFLHQQCSSSLFDLYWVLFFHLLSLPAHSLSVWEVPEFCNSKKALNDQADLPSPAHSRRWLDHRSPPCPIATLFLSFWFRSSRKRERVLSTKLKTFTHAKQTRRRANDPSHKSGHILQLEGRRAGIGKQVKRSPKRKTPGLEMSKTHSYSRCITPLLYDHKKEVSLNRREDKAR